MRTIYRGRRASVNGDCVEAHLSRSLGLSVHRQFLSKILNRFVHKALCCARRTRHIVLGDFGDVAKVYMAVLELQDTWATYAFLQAQPPVVQPSRRTTGIDWPSLASSAELEQRSAANNNDFGFDNAVWVEKYRKLVAERRGQFNDDWFVDNLEHNAEWTDLGVLLRGLAELGAEPLLLSQPIPGKYQDYVGVSATAR